MNFSLWASRKLKLAQSSGANATGVAIAVAGVSLAIIIMECALAVVLGFKNQITERIVGFDSQVTVSPILDVESGQPKACLRLDSALSGAIGRALPSASYSLKFNLPGILKTEDDFAGAYFVGYGQSHGFEFERGAITEGSFPDFFSAADANKIVISKAMANSLGLKVGDQPYAYFFENEAVKQRRLEVGAIYETGFSDYDKTIAFAPISALQKIAGTDSISGTAIAVNGLPFNGIEDGAEALQRELIDMYTSEQIEGLYPVDNVIHTGSMFFSWLDLLDTNVVVIFILMACVAGFTLISSMFILILDRIPAIGLFRSLGATKSQVRMVFVNLAMKIIARGIIIGNIIGLVLLSLQSHFKLLKLDPDMYYLPSVPVEINWWWMLWLNLAVVAAGWCILVIPSALAAGISPSQTMRYE
ncbi:MAG: hypothetical protein NC102_06105 [Clostridium sp.]|nr:hypothetical protein [Clostridium sp.]